MPHISYIFPSELASILLKDFTSWTLQGLNVPGELASAVYEEGDRGYRVRRSGLDNVEFLLAAGPAEPLRSLGAVASGGESARVMLALKAAPALAGAMQHHEFSPAGSQPESAAGMRMILCNQPCHSRKDGPDLMYKGYSKYRIRTSNHHKRLSSYRDMTL